MKNAILAAVLISLTCAASAADRKTTYLGDDRYTCRGSDCGSFNARESQYQGARSAEQVERWRQEDAMRDLRSRSSGASGGIVGIPSSAGNGAPPTYIYVRP